MALREEYAGKKPLEGARIGGIAAAQVIGHVDARPDIPLKEMVEEALD